MSAFIKVSGLSYRPENLPENQPDVLRRITLEIKPGSFCAIIGSNGSGKTTLLRAIAGLLLPTSGQILVDGMDTRDSKHQSHLRSLIGVVFQNPADQIVASTVEEDIAFGLENANLPTAVIKDRVARQLKNLDLIQEASHPPHLLSGGQIQKCALAGVLARQPRILLFDEPTTMLDPLSRKSFLNQIKALHKQGMTLLLVTHHMEEAFQADHIYVLHEGLLKIGGTPAEILEKADMLCEIGLTIPEIALLSNKLCALGWDVPCNTLSVDDLIAALPEYNQSFLDQKQTITQEENDVLIEIKDINYTYLAETPLARPALRGATLSVNGGEIHGLAGSNGSGKSTILQHINGILRPERGTVRVAELAIEDPKTPLKEVIKKVGLVFQSPEQQFFEEFAGDEIAYGPKQLKRDRVLERVKSAMEQVGLNFDTYKDRRIETLSGGEKRKLAIASTLVLDQDVLLFDEPTAGMDPESRDEIMNLFKNLASEGKTIIIASHRVEELAELSQHLSLMSRGQVVNSGLPFQILNDKDLLVQSNLEPPLTVVVSQKLIQKGWPIKNKDTSTPDRLVEAIKEVMG